ncbi:TonB-dependent receptor domain-containing protein [Maribacter sp. MAR_2009_72]|uniref:TonB-dependent receptor domain-containing protein n=1 Tax=Maribacter sp. MAR_2009_72 TaxID=1250050 RepID=UPI00119B6BFF|nr:TonB-dependent receptor [Maribacter sp. MAR_2009_72]TVZ15986.1 outer membrane receptor protein involved in Fe transport [Maribacter sp. MAR_2009_72]
MKNHARLFLTCLGFLLIGFTQAQTGEISGQVQDEAGAVLPGASVLIEGTKNGTMTDFDGKFTLSGLDSGEYQLIVSYVGFSRQKITVSVPQSQPLSVTLSEDATQLDDVVVTGVFDARSKMEASVAITTIGAKQLARVAPTSSADLLKNIPGVFVNQARGEIWNSVYSRGLSANSIDNINGYRYVSLQEDGLPVTNVELYPDLFLRADAMTARVEAVRGGTASILGANAPGGIFNYVSKTGGNEFAGEVRAKYGLEGNGKNPYYRADFNIGGPMSNGWTYNVGGFFRQSDGARDRGYPINKGGQIRANLVKKYNTGSFKLNLKYLNDKNDRMAFIPSTNWEDPQIANGFSKYDSYGLYDFSMDIPFNEEGTRTLNSTDLLHNRDASIGFNWVQDLGNGFSFKNDFKYSRKDDERNATAVVTPISTTEILFYAIPGHFAPGAPHRTGTYRFADPRTGQEFGTVEMIPNVGPGSVPGPPVFLVPGENNNFPGSNIQPNSLLFMPFFYTDIDRNEIANQFTLTKKTEKSTFNLGSFYSRSTLDITNYNKGMGLSGGLIQDRPVPAQITLDANDGNTYEITSPEGFMNVGWTGSNDSETTQGVFALFFGHNWKITPELTLDYGMRYENISSEGFNTIGVANPRYNDPSFGGRDGNPLTIWDNGGGTEGPPINYDYDLSSFSYTAGLNYKFSDQQAIYTRFARGNKAPATSFYLDLNNNDLVNTLNESETLLEEITQFEIGYKVNTEKLKLVATPFYSNMKNVPNIQTFSTETRTNYSPPYQFNEYSTIGFELETTINLTDKWMIRSNAVIQNAKADKYTAWAEGEDGAGDDTIIDFSGNEADNSANLIFNINPIYNAEKFYGSLNYSYMGERQANVPNAFVLPAFGTVDLAFGYDFSKSFGLQLNINNVLDKYGILGWQGPGGFPQALNRDGFSQDFIANNPNATFSTQGSMPRAYFLTATYRF